MYRIPEEIRQYVREHVVGVSNKALAEQVNEKFGTNFNAMSMGAFKNRLGVKSWTNTTYRKGIRNSPATEFKKGHVPVNKGTEGMFPNAGGATRFQKGHRPHNYKPVGSERCNSEGYWEVKIADPKTWKMKHVLVWETANGPVPKGMLVVFLDGDKNNLALDNLALISRATNARRNQCKLFGLSKELGKIGIATAELLTAMSKQRKK